jgi:hypothetical protein
MADECGRRVVWIHDKNLFGLDDGSHGVEIMDATWIGTSMVSAPKTLAISLYTRKASSAVMMLSPQFDRFYLFIFFTAPLGVGTSTSA